MNKKYFLTALNQFNDEAVILNKLSENTLKAKFFNFLYATYPSLKDFSFVKKVHIIDFIKTLESEGFKRTTIDRYFFSIRTFFSFLHESGYIDAIPKLLTEKYKKEKVISEIKTLTLEDIIKISNSFKNISLKEHLMFSALVFALATTGARRCEILNLRWEDVSISNKTIRIIREKNNTDDILPMYDLLFNALSEYAKCCVDNMSGFIFTSSTGNRLSESGFKERMKKAEKLSGIKINLNAKIFRKTFCSTMSAQGHSPSTIAYFTGHKDVNSLKYYITTGADIKNMAIQSLFPNEASA